MSELNEVKSETASRPAEQPAIHFTGIVLDRLEFHDAADGTKTGALDFHFEVERRVLESDTLDVTLGLQIVPVDATGSTFRLQAFMTGRFRRLDGPKVIPIERFAQVNAPALMMPFMRELVTNLTARSRHGPIIFPPLNVNALASSEPRATATRRSQQ